MIEISQLAKSFQRVKVLQSLELKVNKGERIALVGSNGAGKTTLIRCLLGEYHYRGSIQIDGLSPIANRQEVLKKISFVPQLPPPIKMPVGQLLRFSASVCDTDINRMIEVSDRLGLDFDTLKNRPFVKLSGGQKQKLLISIALGRDSNILILDEPAANLDPQARQVFFNLLAENADGKIMFIAIHRLDEVASLVNRVIEMDQGRVVLDDKVEDMVDLNSFLRTSLVIRRPDSAFDKAISDWGFQPVSDTEWNGQVAGPDRLRFLGTLSRYAALLQDVHMEARENQ